MNVIRVNCLECNNEFNKRTTEIKRHPNNFCSRSWAGKYNNRKYPKKELKGYVYIVKLKYLLKIYFVPINVNKIVILIHNYKK